MERLDLGGIGVDPINRRARRWSPSRLRRAVGLSVAVLLILVSTVLGLPRRLAGWVEARSAYDWSLADTSLSPAPPAWIRGGNRTLIRDARPALDSFDGSSALGLDPGTLSRAFKNLEWIEAVERVELTYPSRTTIRVRYRKPVVLVRPGPPTISRPLYLDSNAVFLPSEEVVEESLPNLLAVLGLGRPVDTNPGASWLVEPGAADPDPRALAAVRVATFVDDCVSAKGWPLDENGRPWKLTVIHLGPGPSPMICLQASDGTWLRWEIGGGTEPTDRPDPAARWEMLVEWAARERPGSVRDDQLLDFGRHGAFWLQGKSQATASPIPRDNGP